jgi:glycosyltransferase involved in cell wall biosynthesis
MSETQLPLVSIIIPVYNTEKYLEETINSAINQTWPNKEIIIVDDGSADNSLLIANKFAGPNIKVFSQENKGASAARNKGLSEASGAYIQFLDADDLLSPDKINSQLKQLLGYTDTLSICPVIHFRTDCIDLNKLQPDKKELAYYKEAHGPFEFLLIVYGIGPGPGGMIPVHSWLTPVNLILEAGKWNENLTMNDDGEFFCRVALASKAILVSNDVFCYYRKYIGISVQSMSGNRDLKSLTSQYNSLILIKHHLEQFRKDKRINIVTSKSLSTLLMITYPKYKTLTKKIAADIKKLGNISYSPVMGGRAIEFIKSIFGWKIARLIQYWYHNIIHS